MLGKNLLLTTFCALLSLSTAQAAWEGVKVRGLINSDHYVLTDGRQITLFGVQGLDLEFPAQEEVCLTESTKLQLQQIFENYDLKLQSLGPGLGYLKFGKTDLGEFMISQGLAITNDKKYLPAQTEAQSSHKGRWGQCDPHLNIIKWQKARGRTPWFWEKYHPYLTSPSIGRVVGVPAGNKLLLDNGLRVKLQDLEVPEIDDVRPSYRCFGKKSQQYLENLVLGRKISIRHQYNLLPSYKTIERQVYLPQTRYQNTIWLNQAMIKAGYAKLLTESEDHELIKAQQSVWTDPVGAWEECLIDNLEPKILAEEELVYDLDCPIKGNISGSKKNPKNTYHTPLSSWYKRIAYEQCFADESEAEAAGFTKVK